MRIIGLKFSKSGERLAVSRNELARILAKPSEFAEKPGSGEKQPAYVADSTFVLAAVLTYVELSSACGANKEIKAG